MLGGSMRNKYFASYAEYFVKFLRYAGDASAMTRVHEAFSSKHAYWTEGSPDISDPNYATDWAKWACTFAGILKNWARSTPDTVPRRKQRHRVETSSQLD
jgi:hypothetical protein